VSHDVNAECSAMLAGISAYLDGDLDTTACQAIERHCRDCSRCAALVEGLRETIGLCREAGSRPLPEPVRQRAKASIERLLASGKPSRT
jgi:anti-sigma factor RsiW